jgi:hypothetical protein
LGGPKRVFEHIYNGKLMWNTSSRLCGYVWPFHRMWTWYILSTPEKMKYAGSRDVPFKNILYIYDQPRTS